MGSTTQWQHLESRPHPWRRQLFVAQRKLLASIVYKEMIECQLTPDEAALRWDLSLDAIREIVRYCEENRALIDEERARDG